MGLKHLTFQHAEISFSGGDFTVRGLSLEHLIYIIRHHRANAEDLFVRVTEKVKSGEGVDAQEVGDFIIPLLEAAPELAAQIIACGAGDPADIAVAARIPLAAQVEALERIIDFTFDAQGGPKKFLETVIRLATGTTTLLQDLSA